MRTEDLRTLLEAEGFPILEEGESLTVGRGVKFARLAVEGDRVTATAPGTGGASFPVLLEDNAEFLKAMGGRIRKWLGAAGVKRKTSKGKGKDWFGKVPEGFGKGRECGIHQCGEWEAVIDGHRIVWREGTAASPCKCGLDSGIRDFYKKFRALAKLPAAVVSAEDLGLACRQARALDPDKEVVTLEFTGQGTARVTAESCGIGEFTMEFSAAGTAAGKVQINRTLLADACRDGGPVEVYPNLDPEGPWGFMAAEHAHLIMPLVQR